MFSVAVPVIVGSRNILDNVFLGPAAQVMLLLSASLVSVVVTCVLWLGSVLAMNVMAFGGDNRRVLELCGVAYWSQVPWSLLQLVVLWGLGAPDLSGASSVESIEWRVAQFDGSPAVTTLRLVGAYFGLWLVALHCCVLRAVSGASMRSAWIVGVVLGAVFVVVPWALQRF